MIILHFSQVSAGFSKDQQNNKGTHILQQPPATLHHENSVGSGTCLLSHWHGTFCSSRRAKDYQ